MVHTPANLITSLMENGEWIVENGEWAVAGNNFEF